MSRPLPLKSSSIDPLALPDDDMEKLVTGKHGAPFDILGVHAEGDSWVVRCFAPGAETASLERPGAAPLPMQRLHRDGVFAAGLDARPDIYRVVFGNGKDQWPVTDAYQFDSVLSDDDLVQIAQGTLDRLWQILGAHPRRQAGVEGTGFAVWAPGAARVSVIGDFNDWDGRRHPMRRHDPSGVWELFVPQVDPGTRYKFEVAPAGGGLPQPKADPVAFQSEVRPGNSSRVAPPLKPAGPDTAWHDHRVTAQRTDSPIAIYEVHLGSWRRHADGSWPGYRELAETLVPYVAQMGFTHIEVLPIAEHPFDGSWGYQPTGLFAPTSRFGDADDFRAFVAACHAAGLGLILDWVPAHFPTDPHGLGHFDGTALYEYADPREGYHPDWNTHIYNFARPEVRHFLLANALFWVREFGVDALRVDAVASMLYRDYSRKDGEWIPNAHGGRENLEAVSFLQHLNAQVYGTDASLMMIAEESTAWPGVTRPVHENGLGFGYKWNMGWMHDTLEYMKKAPAERPHHHNQISFPLHYAFSENFILPISHDEVVHEKGSMFARMPGDPAEKLANLRVYYGMMYAHPGKKLLFMGQEFGQRGEWDFDAQLDWAQADAPGHAGLQRMIRDLNGIYRDTPAMHQRDCRADGFEWIEGAASADCVFAWQRISEDGSPPLVAVFNFSDRTHPGWRLGMPAAGYWREIFNSDASLYGGADRGNAGGVQTDAIPRHGRDHSADLCLPALSALYFICETSS